MCIYCAIPIINPIASSRHHARHFEIQMLPPALNKPPFPPTHTPSNPPLPRRTACHYHSGETMWYRKASRYRAERNFWLSLFTLVLWLLVYDIYSLKRQIVILRASSSASATADDVMTTGEFHRRNDKAE